VGVWWAFGEPRPEELDAGLLVWKIHQRINRELLPERRTVVEYWLMWSPTARFVREREHTAAPA
jgi:hypothetical protein